MAGCANSTYHVCHVPASDLLCESILEEHGVYGQVSFHQLALHMIPIDHDLWSFQLPSFFRSIALDGDETPLPWVAKGLVRLQEAFGPFSQIHSIGETAHSVAELYKLLTVARIASRNDHAYIQHVLVRAASYIKARTISLDDFI